MRVLGLRGTRGFHVAAWGAAITVAAAPIDDLWHRLFGIDVTVWSPPHLLGFLGGAVSALGGFVIAREAYPPASRLRLVALVLTGAWLYTGLQPVIEPAYLLAYRHGGIAFHAFAMLAALLLPAALVTAARLTGLRGAGPRGRGRAGGGARRTGGGARGVRVAGARPGDRRGDRRRPRLADRPRPRDRAEEPDGRRHHRREPPGECSG